MLEIIQILFVNFVVFWNEKFRYYSIKQKIEIQTAEDGLPRIAFLSEPLLIFGYRNLGPANLNVSHPFCVCVCVWKTDSYSAGKHTVVIKLCAPIARVIWIFPFIHLPCSARLASDTIDPHHRQYLHSYYMSRFRGSRTSDRNLRGGRGCQATGRVCQYHRYHRSAGSYQRTWRNASETNNPFGINVSLL